MATSLQRRIEPKYNLGFTAGSLLIPESIAVGKCFAESKTWVETKNRILNENLLRKTTSSSNLRTFREVKGRLSTLTHEQLSHVAVGGAKDATALLLVAVCKRYVFISEFITEVLCRKAEVFDFTVRDSDYARFWDERAMTDPSIENTSAKTQSKVREILFRILREAGLLQGNEGRSIGRLFPSKKVIQLLVNDDWRLLRLFLCPESELWTARQKYGN